MQNIYPFKKYYLDIDELIESAEKYKPKYLYNIPKEIKSKNLEKYLGIFPKNNLLIVTDVKESKINDITDYFTEECRVKTCRREYKELTPFEYFNKHKIDIATELEKKGIEINFKSLNRYVENTYAPCSNYKLTYLLGILKHFKPKKWLDLSAGWGDRLCSAFIYGVEEYYAVDPSECLHPYYNEIINYFNERGYKTKAKVEKIGAEKVALKNQYDFIFTSPPFFTFELYEESNEAQSTNLYKNIDTWLNDFLFVTIRKAWKHLEKNGVYAMYIEDKKEYPFIGKLKSFMSRLEGCKYQGVIYQVFYDPRWVKKPYNIHTVYVWVKI